MSLLSPYSFGRWGCALQIVQKDHLELFQIGQDETLTRLSLSSAHLFQHPVRFLLNTRLLTLVRQPQTNKNMSSSYKGNLHNTVWKQISVRPTSKQGLICSNVWAMASSSTNADIATTKSITVSLGGGDMDSNQIQQLPTEWCLDTSNYKVRFSFLKF